MKINKTFILIAIIGLTTLWNTIQQNVVWTGSDNVVVDSTKVTKVIPKKEGSFEIRKKEDLRPIIVNNYIQKQPEANVADQYRKLIEDLQSKYNTQIDSVTILNELLESKKVREYKEVYEDTLMKGVVESKVEGTLIGQKFDYEIKEQAIEYFEKKYTKILKPKFALFTGGGVTTNLKDPEKVEFNFNLGIQNKKGSIWEIFYSTEGNITIGHKFRIFTKY